ncbi:hypothetical protein DM01DRAFT_1385861 [Hesseltinella vesiculosa]|uniref:Uncharacterized protein n=1 Tax=Hesseltinella vesiculosa TaxID=101127 RepID=A0A1X2G840_9FUNG|nr:hypothetical protein DM01DRAFT_1385861 [Hesseltinella vesiculosa]
MTKRTYEETMEDDVTISRPFYSRQQSVSSRYDLLRRQYSGNDYYDPYQREQHEQEQPHSKRKKWLDLQHLPSCHHDQQVRSAKRRKSWTSMIKYGLLQGALFGSAMAMTAVDYVHKAKEQLDDRSKKLRGHGVDFTSYFQPQPRSAWFDQRAKKTEALIRSICLDQQAYAYHHHQPYQDHYWGVVKDDYNVDFTPLPPPKPKLTTFIPPFKAQPS